ncbi:hypothetical protein ACIA8C_22140 [Nocardia sp. NPDC051321]|uniref:hypothetical protein n=1 Tax=Nocardia sp. NPDC051321 TaxID=3364323 RepID=UPI0037A8422F
MRLLGGAAVVIDVSSPAAVVFERGRLASVADDLIPVAEESASGRRLRRLRLRMAECGEIRRCGWM